MPAHARQMAAADAPYLSQFKAMDMDERWVNRSSRTMLETFHWFRGEGFSLIVEDLLATPVDIGVVAEGFRLLPHLVKPLLAETNHAVWLLPAEDFRAAAFDHRDAAEDISSRTRDPERARHNLLERDRLFTDRLRAQTKRLGLSTIEVDTAMSEADLTKAILERFGL